MTKLCPRGKAAAKRKFAVYPSAYANAYASKICAGKIKDPSGKKRKDFKGPKKAMGGMIRSKYKKGGGVDTGREGEKRSKLLTMLGRYTAKTRGAKRSSKAEGGKVKKKKKKTYKRNGMEFDKPLGPKGTFNLGNPPVRYEVAEGGIMNLGGKEMDLRKGGFVPIGKKERADDVPARLSKNEFVMTADAVRAAGGGSVNKGAKRMYNLMNSLEARV